jgi:hypothetical protein
MDRIWRTCARLTLALLAVPLLLGTLVANDPTIGDWARHAVPLPVDPEPPSFSEFLDLLAHNASAALGPVLAAALLPVLRVRCRRAFAVSVLLDVFFALSLTVNGVVLALATASYGPTRVVAWMPHLPLELGALSLSLSIYLAARRRTVAPGELLQTTIALVMLLAAAAVVEAVSQPRI